MLSFEQCSPTGAPLKFGAFEFLIDSKLGIFFTASFGHFYCIIAAYSI